MEARLELEWHLDSWKVWITDRGGSHGRRRVAQPLPPPDGDVISRDNWIDLTENTAGPIAPTLILPTEFLKAIVTAGNEEAGLVAPDRAMAAHLSDAREMRDRLLGMIERGVEAQPLDGGYVVSIRPPE